MNWITDPDGGLTFGQEKWMVSGNTDGRYNFGRLWADEKEIDNNSPIRSCVKDAAKGTFIESLASNGRVASEKIYFKNGDYERLLDMNSSIVHEYHFSNGN